MESRLAEKEIAQEDECRFLIFPEEILVEVGNHLDNKTALAMTCHSLYSIFKPDIEKDQLALAILLGEKEKVNVMLTNNPTLLCSELKGRDYAGNEIKGFPFCLALGAEDSDMYKLILSFFDRIENGALHAKKQWEIQFPSSSQPNEISLYDFSTLIAAISADPMINDNNGEVADILQEFRRLVRPQGIITTGKHFCIQTIMNAFNIYEIKKGEWNENQSNFFWIKVIGYLQRLVPTCYAQAFCQGGSDVMVKKLPLKRSLTLPNGECYFPKNPHSNSGLGFRFAYTLVSTSINLERALTAAFFSRLQQEKQLDWQQLKEYFLNWQSEKKIALANH